jgi:hypothetical protein
MPAFLVLFGDYLEDILLAGLAMLGALFLAVCVSRVFEMARARRERRLDTIYQPIIDALAQPSSAADAVVALSRAPKQDSDVIGHRLLMVLRLTTGATVEPIRAGAAAAGLDVRWRRDIGSGKWWERANAAEALGLLRDREATPLLTPLLDDPREQVRASAVTALGWLADPASVQPLVERLTDETRHQRTRIVEALQHCGPEVTAILLRETARKPALIPLAADLFGHLRLTNATDTLVEWTSHDEAGVRAAALHALGRIGLDDRSFYYALRGLGDGSPAVRAMAARSLGLSRRPDAVPYLEPCLDDEWAVAAEAASALRRLGPVGREALARARDRGGPAGDLASQLLWEAGTATAGSAA